MSKRKDTEESPLSPPTKVAKIFNSDATDVLTTCLDAAKRTILSVGSGDGSQQEAIVKSGHVNVLTTFYDRKALLLQKYPHAGPTLQYLEEHSYRGPQYEIDATKLDTYDFGKFDMIIFTFPHTGVPTSDPNNIPSNQLLLRSFLTSAKSLLKDSGEIQITLKNGDHYDRWNITHLLQSECGLKYNGSHNLDKSIFPGYIHRLTKGMGRMLKEVPDKQGARVHVFQKDGSVDESKDDCNSVLFLGKMITVFGWSGPQNWTDEEVWAEIVNILTATTISFDVLEIRRRIELQPPLPNTRQLNRILYGKNGRGSIIMHPPTLERPNKKPTWELPRLP